jgi:hypothetical protein
MEELIVTVVWVLATPRVIRQEDVPRTSRHLRESPYTVQSIAVFLKSTKSTKGKQDAEDGISAAVGALHLIELGKLKYMVVGEEVASDDDVLDLV